MFIGLNDSVRCKLSKAERQRQNYIQELITTEDAYNSDMALVLGVIKCLAKCCFCRSYIFQIMCHHLPTLCVF